MGYLLVLGLVFLGIKTEIDLCSIMLTTCYWGNFGLYLVLTLFTPGSFVLYWLGVNYFENKSLGFFLVLLLTNVLFLFILGWLVEMAVFVVRRMGKTNKKA